MILVDVLLIFNLVKLMGTIRSFGSALSFKLVCHFYETWQHPESLPAPAGCAGRLGTGEL